MTLNVDEPEALGIDVGVRLTVKGLLASLGPVATSVTVPVKPLRGATFTVVVTVVGVVAPA